MSRAARTGEGTATVPSDVATLSIGVETQEDTATQALADNTAQSTRVINTLKASGVEARDIQTSNFSVQPVYDNRKTSVSGGPEIGAYRVTNQVTARIRDLDGLGVLLDKVVTGGANRVHGLRFGASETQEAEDKARERAVADARRKAELYAKALGVTLGPIISVSESVAGPMPHDAVYARAESLAVPIERGETGLSVSVHIMWKLAD